MNDTELAIAIGMVMSASNHTYSRQTVRKVGATTKKTKNKRKAQKLSKRKNR